MAFDMRNSEKCVSAYYPEGTRLDVLYEILDPKKDKLSLGVKIADGPLSSTKVIFQINPSKDSNMPRTPSNMVTREVSETEGRIRYKGEGEGKVDICIRIQEMPGKKYIKPALIGFRIAESGELENVDEPEVDKSKLTPEELQTQSKAKAHMSEMERVLNKMIRDASLLLKNADLIAKDESAFSRQSEEMNAASKWWPMLHMIVLLVMGFTQSNHVLKFFKGKHIL